jgi:NADPH:quinone reductase-like Zn-dependent oxidoreductase
MSDLRVLHSTVAASGELRVTVDDATMPQPGADEVVVRVEAAPINPSDLGMLLAGADPAKATSTDGALTIPLSSAALVALAGRVDKPMIVGNVGAGTVVATGSSAAAQALDGKLVAVLAGGMYATHRRANVASCLLLDDGTTAEQGASCFVNPLTALGMVETMRLEGHTALVHTAAASNLGQMLQRICLADDVALVNIVRRPEQADLLRTQGATWVCDSSAATFTDDLTDALTETGATIAFDAIGGGDLASTILTCMERAASAGQEFNRYGSDTLKQVYIYGGLDRSPTTLTRNFRDGLEPRWLAAHPVPGADRRRGHRTPSATGRLGDHHHVRQYLHRPDLTRPGDRRRRRPPLRQDGDGREVPRHAPGVSSTGSAQTNSPTSLLTFISPPPRSNSRCTAFVRRINSSSLASSPGGVEQM